MTFVMKCAPRLSGTWTMLDHLGHTLRMGKVIPLRMDPIPDQTAIKEKFDMITLVRSLALILVVAGIVAATHPPAIPTTQAAVSSSAAEPVPVCPPNDPDACHIEQW
jgi:hypothetical protein